MISFDDERFIEDLSEIQKRYLNLSRRCEMYRAALESPDKWAVPNIETKDGQFQYIPFDLEGLADIFMDLADTLPDDPDFSHSRQPIRPLSLVEVGCGIGRNLNLFRSQEMIPLSKIVGFDIVPEYIDVARRIYGFGNNAFVQDAMTFEYTGFDLIFFYRPFSDDALEAAFEEKLMASAKPGSVILGLNTETLHTSRLVAEFGTTGNCYKKL
ncbi:Methyltransferase type 11 [Sulfitobacter noctilucae]|uniref:class I SAM-dependent methyltransferase n=1 Tax=Sulfitobacter noctilucae TaxID=1342302 RepID=UPI000469FE06|nr:class I SAM-dependent methyltransferase [Sulfitobacter noctilucae]KIN75253.1 Methyltransferase type 11 [Sulfitobacter noctilucae]